MRLTFTQEQEELRHEVHDFLHAELKAGTFKKTSTSLVAEGSQAFSRKMAQKGWIGLAWPKEFWGQGRSYVDKMILNEECFKVQAPINYHFLADRQVGPVLMQFGDDWQKEYFLPRIAHAEENMQFCLLFSEPNAGSDMASVSTSAVKDGDFYVINGQKVWTGSGHMADYGWMLAKTNFDPSVPKHRASSEFIIDMKTPGITIRPIINSAGGHSFNEVFFEEVRIEKKYLVGKENDGFTQIMAQMDYERAGMERLLQNYPIYLELMDYGRTMKKTAKGNSFYPWVRDRLAQLEVEFNTGRLLCYYSAWMVDQGQKPSSQAALTKAFCTQLEQRVNDIATMVLGPVSQIKEGVQWSPFEVDLANCYNWGPSYTLQGGSTEILKNIIAQRGLKLPRG